MLCRSCLWSRLASVRTCRVQCKSCRRSWWCSNSLHVSSLCSAMCLSSSSSTVHSQLYLFYQDLYRSRNLASSLCTISNSFEGNNKLQNKMTQAKIYYYLWSPKLYDWLTQWCCRGLCLWAYCLEFYPSSS